MVLAVGIPRLQAGEDVKEMERRLLVEKAEKDRLAAENKILREMLTGRSV